METTETCGLCSRPIPAHETAFVHDGQPICRDCHDAKEPTCPYCQKLLPARPGPYSNCPFCHETIQIRVSQNIFPSVFLTRAQADELATIEEAVAPLRRFGLTPLDFVHLRAAMRQDMDADPAKDDVVLGLFYTASKATTDNAKLAEIFAAQAAFLNRRDQPAIHVQRRQARHFLLSLRDRGVTAVRIVGDRARCAECAPVAGRTLTLDEALARLPVPAPECRNTRITLQATFRNKAVRDTDVSAPFCECRYEPVV